MTLGNVFVVLPYLSRPPFEQQRPERIHRERRIAELTRREGHSCTLYATTFGTYVSERDDEDMVLVPVDRPRQDGPHDHTSRVLLAEVERQRPDLVVFKGMGYRMSRWLVLKSRHRFRCALIAAGGAQDPLTPFADYVLAETQNQVERHLMRVLPPDRIGILPKLTYPSRSAEPVTRDLDVINVGGFTANKNQQMLLPLADRYRVALLGDGELWGSVRSAASRHGDRVIMPGDVPRDIVASYIGRSRLMVHSARSEGVARVVMEAFACGVPVVALKGAMPGAFEHGVQGLLVGPDELLDAARGLLEDPDRLAEMGRAALEFAQSHCSEEAVFTPVRRMYETVFAGDPAYRGTIAQVSRIRLGAARMAAVRWAGKRARSLGLRRAHFRIGSPA